MPKRGDDLPSADEFERVLKRALHRYGLAPENPEDDPTPETRFHCDDPADLVTTELRSCGLIPSPALAEEVHPLASAGLKLKELRVGSGWTVEEIADRTRIPLDLLIAFENGDSNAAGEMTTFLLEALASACCGTLADLLGPEHSWARAAGRRRTGFVLGRGGSIDPHG